MKKFIFSLVAVLLAVSLLTTPAFAYVDWQVFGIHVTMVDPSAMPSFIVLTVDTAVGPCSAGAYIQYDPQGTDATAQQANVKSVLAMLLSAKLSGQTVSLAGSNTLNSFGRCVVSSARLGNN